MSFHKKYSDVALYFATIWVFTVAAPSADDFLSDYYWGSTELRTREELNCDSDIVKLICDKKCGNSHQFSKCKDNKCECFDTNEGDKAVLRTIDRLELYYPFEDNQYLLDSNEFVNNGLGTAALQMPVETEPKEEISEHPTLRHHIAHFCPNLELARNCIRSCMKLGKPAFCGKDHVCYCGHKYNSNDVNKPMNLNDMYAEFRDLYEKYFGPQDSNGFNNNDDHENGDETDLNDEENKEELTERF